MKCSNCGSEMQGNFCENCGAPAQSINQPYNNAQNQGGTGKKKAKIKKPIYQKWWFWFGLAIVVLLTGQIISKNIERKEYEDSMSQYYSQIVDNYSTVDTAEYDEPEIEKSTTTTTTATVTEADMVDGMRRDFKEAMDSYEEFFNEYVEFMEKYKNGGNSISMLSEYTKFMTEYTEMMNEMNELKDDDLNKAELAYYLDVTNRINKKLLEVADY